MDKMKINIGWMGNIIIIVKTLSQMEIDSISYNIEQFKIII
jgi:hypothetical protein